MSEPKIIQGGMGVGVSGWPLARAVSQLGQLGVVSGTAIDVVFVRRLQQGDPGGHLRRALDQFPIPGAAGRILKAYFIPRGKPPDEPFKSIPMHTNAPSRDRLELTVASNFTEVFLAKEGHSGLVGINYLEKIQLPTLSSLYGAMLAGVDYVLMGAGIPREIPGVLDRLARHEEASLSLHVEGAGSDDNFRVCFDPKRMNPAARQELKRPKFLAIIASEVLALTLVKKAAGRTDGFVIEGPTAGGHNAPPRGRLQLNERGEPLYGAKDEVDLEKIRELGLPFWLAGSYGHPEKLQEALAAGAAGIQVGTAFAFCEESGISEEIKSRVLQRVLHQNGEVFTDPLASSSGFPFKVVQLEGSLSEPDVCRDRPRRCDLGFLRRPYKGEDGLVGYRCPGEPVDVYLKKGGRVEETMGRLCLCNGLLSTIGFAQRYEDGYVEPPLITAGDDLKRLGHFLGEGKTSYGAKEVVAYLLGK